MDEETKYINVKEFRELGFLQEVNRRFFHPLGLALEVIIDDETGKETLGQIWDYREDPKGMFYGPYMLDIDKARYVEKLRLSKVKTRRSSDCSEDGIQFVR